MIPFPRKSAGDYRRAVMKANSDTGDSRKVAFPVDGRMEGEYNRQNINNSNNNIPVFSYERMNPERIDEEHELMLNHPYTPSVEDYDFVPMNYSSQSLPYSSSSNYAAANTSGKSQSHPNWSSEPQSRYSHERKSVKVAPFTGSTPVRKRRSANKGSGSSGSASPRYRCRACGISFPNWSQCLSHVRTTEGDKDPELHNLTKTPEGRRELQKISKLSATASVSPPVPETPPSPYSRDASDGSIMKQNYQTDCNLSGMSIPSIGVPSSTSRNRQSPVSFITMPDITDTASRLTDSTDASRLLSISPRTTVSEHEHASSHSPSTSTEDLDPGYRRLRYANQIRHIESFNRLSPSPSGGEITPKEHENTADSSCIFSKVGALHENAIGTAACSVGGGSAGVIGGQRGNRASSEILRPSPISTTSLSPFGFQSSSPASSCAVSPSTVAATASSPVRPMPMRRYSYNPSCIGALINVSSGERSNPPLDLEASFQQQCRLDNIDSSTHSASSYFLPPIPSSSPSSSSFVAVNGNLCSSRTNPGTGTGTLSVSSSINSFSSSDTSTSFSSLSSLYGFSPSNLGLPESAMPSPLTLRNPFLDENSQPTSVTKGGCTGKTSGRHKYSLATLPDKPAYIISQYLPFEDCVNLMQALNSLGGSIE